QFVSEHDSSLAAAERKADDIKAEGRRAGLIASLSEGKPGGAPYLEDLGIDSVVYDEAHVAKNSSKTAQFKSARFLALPDTSGIGEWLQAVAWYIRGLTAKSDGVMCLTATPITNSPLEIHAMLSLAVGRDKINDLMLGATGADAFMELICDVEVEDDESLDGIVRQTRVFRGLRNVDVLRRAIGSVATIETAESVGKSIKLPDQENVSTPVELSPAASRRLQEYKRAFRWAIDEMSGRDVNRGDQGAFDRVQARTGEPIALIGHPFNMVRKMNRLIIDPDLDEGGTFFFPSDDELARAAIAKFNALKITEERIRPGPLTAAEDVKAGKVKQAGPDDDPEVKTYKVGVKARLEILPSGRSRIAIDTLDGANQQKFEAIAEKLKLGLEVSISPKLAALIENVKAERAAPRGVGGIVKQIIFCDELGMHRKIVRLLVSQCGISPGKIAIITGKTNNKPEEIIDIQNGYNAHGAENRFEVVIANEKAEVGLNLQQGTQAIHHLTIGWTPDSLVQRNGRGVRQGNSTDFVRVYSYDAEGTFDVAKRAMVDRKADWIDNVMDISGGSRVAVSGGLTREQEEALIDSVGDPGAIERAMREQAAAEKAQRAESNQRRQMVGLEMILSNRDFLENNESPQNYAAKLIFDAKAASDALKKVVSARDAAKERAKEKASKNGESGSQVEFDSSKYDAAIAKARTAYIVACDEVIKNFDGVTETSIRQVFAAMDLSLAKGERLGIVHAVRAIAWEKLSLKVDCPIREEWASRMDQARRLIAESIRTFSERSGEDGALNSGLAKAFADGEGRIHNGRVIVKGALLKAADHYGEILGVFTGKDSVASIYKGDWSTGGFDYIASRASELLIVPPGQPGFDSLAGEIARAEDVAALKNTPREISDTVGFNSPAVAALRKEKTLVAMLWDQRLPA
ncbi:MAG: hypothetical protein RIS17_1171, partial [Pseudomonadota bacterium]